MCINLRPVWSVWLRIKAGINERQFVDDAVALVSRYFGHYSAFRPGKSVRSVFRVFCVFRGFNGFLERRLGCDVDTSGHMNILHLQRDASYNQSWMPSFSSFGMSRKMTSRWDFLTDNPCICTPTLSCSSKRGSRQRSGFAAPLWRGESWCNSTRLRCASQNSKITVCVIQKMLGFASRLGQMKTAIFIFGGGATQRLLICP